MRSFKILFIMFSFLVAKDITFKIHNLGIQEQNIISLNGSSVSDNYLIQSSRTSREDTSTVWLQDFEGDISDWTIEEGWELTEESSYSPSHSFNFDDDNYGLVSSLVSPIISVPSLTSEFELLKMNFALWVDFPDFDGDADNYLDD